MVIYDSYFRTVLINLHIINWMVSLERIVHSCFLGSPQCQTKNPQRVRFLISYKLRDKFVVDRWDSFEFRLFVRFQWGFVYIRSNNLLNYDKTRSTTKNIQFRIPRRITILIRIYYFEKYKNHKDAAFWRQ